MDRTDFIENRIDVVKNIYRLYTYAKSNVAEDKNWALQRFKQGRWYIVEPIGDTLLFAPSRFVGYKNNTKEKHILNPGDGTKTNKNFCELKLYKEIKDDYLSEQFESFIKNLGVETNIAQFFIPYDLEVEDLKRHHKCYFICPTHCKGQKENAWKDFLARNIMAIGWKDTDYTNFTIDEIKQDYTNDPTAIGPFTLMKQIKDGDIICCTNNQSGLWGIGVALSSYKYQHQIHFAGTDVDGHKSYYSHYIDVAWLSYKNQGYIPTAELNVQSPEAQWQPYGTLTQKTIIPQYISNYLLRSNKNMEKNKNITKYIELLKANKNLILTGAPGTGKTYLARSIAEAMAAEHDFVQFHPSYDYTDFVEGLRPTQPDKNGNIGFERKDGVFKEFCKKAIQSTNDISQNVNNAPKETSDEDNKIKKAMDWLMTQNGAILKSKRSNNEYSLIINQNKIYLRIPKGKDTYVNPKGIIRYLKTGEYNKEHQTYEPAVGLFIKENCPSYTNNTYSQQKDNTTTKETHSFISNKTTCYVFIIDEINRGEISKIFGELFFSIDPGYRGKDWRVKTQYQNLIKDESDPFYEGFYIPENVYIIGTMNDIDRSVESMDFAMRRRFAWVEIKANDNTEMLNDKLADMKDEVVHIMKRLNSAIWDEENNTGIEGLSPAYHIGGAYFNMLSLYLNEDHSNKESAYKHLWENHLKGVLFEYLRGTAQAVENLNMLEHVYFNEENHDNIEG